MWARLVSRELCAQVGNVDPKVRANRGKLLLMVPPSSCMLTQITQSPSVSQL